MPKRPKQPKAAFKPEPQKIPRAAPIWRGASLVWRFSTADKGGPFAWAALAEATLYKRVMETLHNFETMEEKDIRSQGSHAVEIEQLCKDAKDRLTEIELDDLDALMSFRLAGKARVWCRMDRNVMQVLWWDPQHQGQLSL